MPIRKWSGSRILGAAVCAFMVTAFFPADQGWAQATSVRPEEDQAVAILESVAQYLFSHDSIPELGLPSPASLLRQSRARGVAASVSMWPSAEFHFPDSGERMDYVSARVVQAMLRQGLDVHQVTKEKGRGSESYAFIMRAENGSAVLCARVLRRETTAECEFSGELALAIQLGYPVPRGDMWDVPVDVYSSQRYSNLQQVHLHLTVRTYQSSGRWQVSKVLRQALISPGRR